MMLNEAVLTSFYLAEPAIGKRIGSSGEDILTVCVVGEVIAKRQVEEESHDFRSGAK